MEEFGFQTLSVSEDQHSRWNMQHARVLRLRKTDRNQFAGMITLGNAVKLPGLQQYLSKNLGYEVNNFQAFKKLQGSSVIIVTGVSSQRS